MLIVVADPWFHLCQQGGGGGGGGGGVGISVLGIKKS